MEPRILRPIKSQIRSIRRMVGLVLLQFRACRKRELFEGIHGRVEVALVQLGAVERVFRSHARQQVNQPTSLKPHQIFGREGLFIHDVV